mmetsp:Transcript_84481/g.243909  ORF Transcript_84481/g.243909 Transcript_84481/m.243909 type:complete len:387 (+) Transcript_84481:443-1603(+)
MAFHSRPDADRIDQEGVMAEVRVQLVVHDAHVAGCPQTVGDLLLLPHGEQDVVLHTDHQRRLHDGRQAQHEARLPIGSRFLHCEAVHGLGNPQQRVRVVAAYPLSSLMRQVPLDLELVLQPDGGVDPRPCETALAKALLPLLARPVRDGAQLTRQAQAVLRQRTVVVVAFVPVWVVHDRRPLGMAESDAPREAFRAGRDRHYLTDAVGEACGRADALHTSQRSAHRGMQLLDVQEVEQLELCRHLVLDLKTWERAAEAPAGSRVNRRRAGGAIATSQVVRAHDVEQVCVQRFTWANVILPPALIWVLRVRAGVGRSRHAAMQQDRVVPGAVEMAPSLVSDLQLRKNAASGQMERLLRMEHLVTGELAGDVRGLLLLGHGEAASTAL